MKTRAMRCQIVGLLACSFAASALVKADEPREVYGTFQLPAPAIAAPPTRGGEPAAAASANPKLPSDVEVLKMARESGAKMTRGGLVMPKTKLKSAPPHAGSGMSPPPAPVLESQLTEQDKMIQIGRPEAPSSTRGQTAYAYIFIKPENVYGAGHIGWGYWAPNMNYYVCGSTENPATTNPLSSIYIQAGWGNGYWSRAYYTESEMFNRFKEMGYYAYKRKMVSNPNPNLAWGRACYTEKSGFRGIGWNCLDHTYYILEGYGVTGMPWKQTNPMPNGWFNAFPTTAYRLP